MMAAARRKSQNTQVLRPRRQSRGAAWVLSTVCAPLWAGVLLVGCGGGEAPAGSAAPGAPEAATEKATAGPAALVSPGAEVSLSEGFSFRWTAPAGADQALWRVVVLEDPQRAIWRSDETAVTEVEAPPALLLRLAPERRYTWRVLGRLPGQGRLEPAEGTFTTR